MQQYTFLFPMIKDTPIKWATEETIIQQQHPTPEIVAAVLCALTWQYSAQRNNKVFVIGRTEKKKHLSLFGEFRLKWWVYGPLKKNLLIFLLRPFFFLSSSSFITPYTPKRCKKKCLIFSQKEKKEEFCGNVSVTADKTLSLPVKWIENSLTQ